LSALTVMLFVII